MKKLFLGLIATVMFCFAGNAQVSVYSKSSMVVLVNQAKSTYTKGLSYQDWLSKQIGNDAKPTLQEEKFLKEVYGFLSTGAKSDAIFKNYDGNTLLELAKLQEKGGLTAMGTANARCGWFCQLLMEIIRIIIDAVIIMP
ncbi:hypothetical protein [Flavobacterium sp.]|uniref:hypothetical protein n=1 Tax=Flavobacterium sp. TaxID=239 RepID=UPI00262F5902|nr:hypothetical protein [Flavobacterium sp.]